MHSTIERMDGCGDSIEVIAVPLKERIAGTCFFFGNKHPVAERISETMVDCQSSCRNKYITVQRMDDVHSFCDKNRKSSCS